MSAAEPGIRIAASVALPNFRLELELTLPQSGVSALYGPSGSGKTTALRLISGLVRGQGSVHVLGECWQDDALGVFVPPHRRAIGYVFQESSLFPHLDVRGNLHFAERRRRGAAPLDFQSLVELLGIGLLLRRDTAHLSGGERQRVAIARALLTGPKLLLMDEPLAALDAARKAEIVPYLLRLRDELSLPVVYVSHAIDEVARLADHLVLLDQGRVLASEPIGGALARLDLSAALGADAGVVIEGVLAQHDAEFHLSRVDFAGGSLWVGRVDGRHGTPVRARVLARDVSLSLDAPGRTSILNVLPARVLELSDNGPDRVDVRLEVGGERTALLARITRRSRAALELRAGSSVFAQVKSVALLT